MKKKQLKQIVVTLCLLMGICSQVKADDFVTTITDGYYYNKMNNDIFNILAKFGISLVSFPFSFL